MKKLSLLSIAITAILSVCIGYIFNQKNLTMDSIELKNIEALTNDESAIGYESVYYVNYGDHWGCNCYGTGNKYCC